MYAQLIRALVTTGGTREPIDEVRYIGNHSTGAFGVAIARALLEQYVETTVLAGKHARGLMRGNEPFVIRDFDSFRDLDAVLTDETAKKPNIIFMAAAVADYSPTPQVGKISSDADELTITLQRNQKLIGKLREQCGVETFIVGFKLLSGVSRDELVYAAREQLEKNHLNLVVANDLSEIHGDTHPVIVVTPEGGAITMTGTKNGVARQLVRFVLMRHKTTWIRSCALFSHNPPTVEYRESHEATARLLAFAQDAGLLPTTDGNVSHRADRGFWITPRHVKKNEVRPDDLIFVRSVFENVRVEFEGAHKPSIDSPVHAYLYDSTRIQSLMHFHEAIVLTDFLTQNPYPCGTLEEAKEIFRVLLRAVKSNRLHAHESFAVQLAHHGYLVGLETGGVERVIHEWTQARTLYREHLHEIGYGEPESHGLKLTPIFSGASIIGVWAYQTQERYGSCFIVPEYRKQKLGSRVLAELKRRGVRVAVHDDCRVLDYYRAHGWKMIDRHGKISILATG